MLLYPDGRSALQVADAIWLADESDAATEEATRILNAACETVPQTRDEFAAAAALLRFLVKFSETEHFAQAMPLADEVYDLVRDSRLDAGVAKRLREMLPLFNMVTDPMVVKLVLTMLVAFRPHAIQ